MANKPISKFIVLHPLFFAVYPILYLMAVNRHERIPLLDFIRPLSYSLFVSLIIFVCLWAILKNWDKAGLLTTLYLLLYYFYGHIYFSIASWKIGTISIGRPDYLAAAWSVVFILGTYGIIRILKNARPLSTYLNWVGLLLIIWPSIQVFSYFLNANHESRAASSLPSIDQPIVKNNDPIREKPDIYYFILDGYGRSDVLAKRYGIDNSPFIQALEGRGFQIAQESYTNYPKTIYSLASSLNFVYLDGLSASENEQPDDFFILHQFLNTTPLLQFLRSQGYSTVAVEDDYGLTQLDSADKLIPIPSQSNYFEYILAGTTLSVLWNNDALAVSNLVGKPVLQQLKALEGIVSQPSPKFVYAHILIPHPPFVLDENGNLIPATGIKNTGWIFTGREEEYRQGYTKQIQYANKRILGIIDNILENSQTKPIIIIQGDHGPNAVLDGSDQSCYKARFAILNAYYLPYPVVESNFYEKISPVNSFRMVLNTVFHTDLPFLEDRSFMPTGSGFVFKDITQVVDTCYAEP